MKQIAVFFGLLLLALQAGAAGLEGISGPEMTGGLKEALSKGSAAAVAKLGKENGFLDDERLKIPLPPTLARVEGVLRAVGMGKQADELVVSMNHAAEMAVAEAKPLLLDAIKKMSVDDAKGILTGGNDAATAYFRRTTGPALTEKFLPIVRKKTEKVGLANTYNGIAQKAAKLGIADEKQANIERYVTEKALDSLYATIAEEERAIRQNPVGYGGKLLKKVFGALK